VRYGYVAVIGSILIILGAGITCSATSDSTGDIWHYKQSETEWTWERFTGEKPNIDITDISYTTTDSQLTITMTVAGTIEDKPGLAYYVYIVRNTTGVGNLAYYTNGLYYVWGDTMESAHSETVSHAGSDTITFTMNYSDPSGIVGVWGYAYEVADVNTGTSGEYWGDWAPDTYFPAYDQYYGDTGDQGADDNETGGDTGDQTDSDTTDETGGTSGNSKDGTPGFELLFVFLALITLIFIKRKR